MSGADGARGRRDRRRGAAASGPHVARAPRRRRRDARARRRRRRTASRRGRRRARRCRRAASTCAASTCSTRRRAAPGPTRSSSASGASTGSCTSSAAGAAASRSTSAARGLRAAPRPAGPHASSTRSRAFHAALAESGQRALRARLLRRRRRRRRRRTPPTRAAKAAAEAWTLALADALRRTARPRRTSSSSTRSSRRRCARRTPTRRTDVHRRRRTSPTALAFLCSDAAGEDERPAPRAAPVTPIRADRAASPPTTTPAPTRRCSRRSPRANDGHAGSYGDDPWTERADEAVPRALRRRGASASRSSTAPARTCSRSTRVTRPAGGGRSAPRAPTSHVDECGAPERCAGVKLLTVATPDGKLDARRSSAPGRRGAATSTHVQPRRRLDHRSRPSSAPSTRSTRCARSPTRPTSGACSCTSTAPGSPTPRPRSTSRSRALTTDAGVDVALASAAPRTALLVGEAVVFLDAGARPRASSYMRKQAHAARLEDALPRRPVRGAARAATSGAATPSTRTRWPPASPPPSAASTASSVTHPVEANGVFATLPRPAIDALLASCPASTPSTSGTRPRRGPLDVLLGHDRGRRRRPPRRRPRRARLTRTLVDFVPYAGRILPSAGRSRRVPASAL